MEHAGCCRTGIFTRRREGAERVQLFGNEFCRMVVRCRGPRTSTKSIGCGHAMATTAGFVGSRSTSTPGRIPDWRPRANICWRRRSVDLTSSKTSCCVTRFATAGWPVCQLKRRWIDERSDCASSGSLQQERSCKRSLCNVT